MNTKQEGLRNSLKKLIPPKLITIHQRLRLSFSRQKNRKRSTREIFSQVYKNNEWGGSPGTYCSGTGSNDLRAVPYAAMVNDFIESHAIKDVVDLGCGDFA